MASVMFAMFFLPATRAASDPKQQVDESVQLHFFQTDHRMILMRHVEFRDSVFVQTLTEADMENFKITDAERESGEKYVVSLNELLNNHED